MANNFITSDGGELVNRFLTNVEFVDRFTAAQVWGWGNNSLGQIDHYHSSGIFTPVIKYNKPRRLLQYGTGTSNANVALESSWTKIANKSIRNFGLKSDGTLWYWGGSIPANGSNDWTITRPPSQTETYYNIPSYGDGSYDLSCGSAHVAIITYSGSLVSWGNNYFGQIGDGTTTRRTELTLPITGNSGWKKVSCGANNTSAIKTDGTLWAWGLNNYGQLGDGTAINKSSPVQNILTGNNWNQVASGYEHTLAIKTDGTLWAWGRNDYGQLGDGTVIDRSSPVQLPGNTWQKISAGNKHSAAIKTDGTLWLWGYNTDGGLGDNTVIHKSSPVQTVSGGTTWKSVSCGNTHTVAIKTDGVIWSWGYNLGYALGAIVPSLSPAVLLSRSSPVQLAITGMGTKTGYWKQVAAADDYTLAVGFNI